MAETAYGEPSFVASYRRRCNRTLDPNDSLSWWAMAKESLVVLILGDEAERSPVMGCLKEISRWELILNYSSHFPLGGERLDLCITTSQNPPIREFKHQFSNCPVVAITTKNMPLRPSLEVIPPDQLTPLTLELSIRLLLNQKQNAAPALISSPWSKDYPCQHLFEMMGDVMILLKPDFKIAAWNQAAEAIYGYNEEMVLGEDYDLLFSLPGDRQTLINDFQAVLDGTVVGNHDHTIVARDGSLRRLNWNLTRFIDDNGEIGGVFCCGREILPQIVQANNTGRSPKKKDISTIFEQIMMGVAWISPQGYLLETNPIFGEFLGYDTETLKGLHCVDLFDPKEAAISLEVIEDILNGKHKTFRCEQPYLTPQGDRRWLETTFIAAQPDETGKIPFILLLVQDVTERPPSAHDLRTHLQLTTTLAQFSQYLLRPQSSLGSALGILGKQLHMERVSIVQWHWNSQKQISQVPTILEQWSSDGSPPCHEKIEKMHFSWWRSLLQLGDLISIQDRRQQPNLCQQLKNLNIYSFLGIPILDNTGQLWGHLIFTGDRLVERAWSPFELQTLKMAAELIHHNMIRSVTQRELEASEALYSGIITHSAEAIFLMKVVSSTEFVFEMVNPTYCEKMGIPLEQILGQTPWAIFPPKLAQQMQDSFRGALQMGETMLFEEMIELEKGTQIWRTCLIPIRDRQGKIRQIQGSGRDVTEERQLELTKMRYSRHQHLLASLTIKILQSWQMEKILAATLEELRKTLQADRVIFWEILNQTEGKVTTEAAIANVGSMLDLILPTTAFDRGDFEMFRHGEIQTCLEVQAGKFPPVHEAMLSDYQIVAYAVLPVLVSPMDDAEGEPMLKGLISVQQCHVTEPWGADELLLMRQLTNQICIALNQAELIHRQQQHTHELARSNHELEQFAYVASHDLQEPLQIVSNYAQLLQKRNKTNLDERSLRYVYHIVEGTKQMQNQIEALLRYSRLNTRQNPFKAIAMKDCLDRAIANLNLKLKRVQAQLTIPDDLPIVWGDVSQIQSLWQNLLSNAIKYQGDRPLEILINYEKVGNHWQFMVQDNGVGIDPKHKERIFQIFQRLHTPEEYPGTGIGLAICQRIIKIHGGEIWVQSEPQKGATFYFTLPVYQIKQNPLEMKISPLENTFFSKSE